MNKRAISIQSIRLTFYDLGSGYPILFLHGGRIRALTFKKTLTELSKTHRVVAPDIPGYGDSSTPLRPWSFKEYAQFFLEVLEKLKIDKVTVIGYSLGGGIAYHLTSLTPKVKKLILIDSAGVEINRESESHKDISRLLFYLSRPQYLLTFLSLLNEYARFMVKHLGTSDRIQNIRKNLNNSSQYLKGFTIPTIIIWAINDEFFPFSIAKKLNSTIQKSTLVPVKGTHDWPLYKNEDFNSILNRYLD